MDSSSGSMEDGLERTRRDQKREIQEDLKKGKNTKQGEKEEEDFRNSDR